MFQINTKLIVISLSNSDLVELWTNNELALIWLLVMFGVVASSEEDDEPN